MALLEHNRLGDSVPVDPAKVEQDAKELYKAGEKRWGTDEGKFIEIMTQRSYAHLAAVFQAYTKYSKNDFHDAIRREMSGNLKRAMQTIVEIVRDPVEYYTNHIYRSMHGLGTHNHSLINLLIDRSEIDLGAIKELFQQKYEKSLAEWFDAETAIRWNYKRLLLTIIGEAPKK